LFSYQIVIGQIRKTAYNCSYDRALGFETLFKWHRIPEEGDLGFKDCFCLELLRILMVENCKILEIVFVGSLDNSRNQF
jgi:hypothetical protein